MKNRRKIKKITLDNEVLTRSDVKSILANTATVNNGQMKKKKKSIKETQVMVKRGDSITANEKQNEILIDEETNKNLDPQPVSDNDIPQEVVKNEESKRSLKRKRYAQLLREKQLKSILSNQQRCLNYLSLWKHDKSKWKFEKLRQTWLQHNMYDTDKVPDDFFNILIDYFVQSKGKIKDAIVENAIKIVEEEQLADTDSKDGKAQTSSNEIKLFRARTVVQNLGI